MANFIEGQYIIHRNGHGFELGRVRRICDDKKSAFVFYHSGDTAAKTNFLDMYPIPNDMCILDTNFGGDYFIQKEYDEFWEGLDI